jgi:hypothetical protein
LARAAPRLKRLRVLAGRALRFAFTLELPACRRIFRAAHSPCLAPQGAIRNKSIRHDRSHNMFLRQSAGRARNPGCVPQELRDF